MSRSKLFSALGIFLVAFGLMGCPTTTTCPLVPQQQADTRVSSLVGTWKTLHDGADVTKVRIMVGKEPNTYQVEVLEKNKEDIPTSFTAWLGTFNKQRFLILREHSKSYYTYAIDITGGNSFVLHGFYSNEPEDEPYTSTAAYQKGVQGVINKPDFLLTDEQWIRQ